MMNIAFRVDGSHQIGTGHVMRCLALAEVMRQRGCHVLFICRDLPGHLNAFIETQKGFTVSILNADSPDIEQTEAALRDLSPGEGWDWLIVDHYEWDATQETAMRAWVRNILVIDDLANRMHDCDVLLDQNYFPHAAERYKPYVPAECKLLLGPHFALLRPEFAALRKQLQPKPLKIQKLLVSFGGSDPTGETLKVLNAMAEMDTTALSIDVILGGANPNAERMQAMAEAMPAVTCYRHVADMAQRMAQADLFIGAGGSTTWERLALGLPGIIITIADNQVELSTALAEEGEQVFLGSSEQVTAEIIRQAISVLIQQPGLCRKMGQAGLSRVDGLGCQRVVELLMRTPIILRSATLADTELTFEWRNHEETRRFAMQPHLIPWEEHEAWFKDTLVDPNRILLIGEQNGQPIGVLRYDCHPASQGQPSHCVVSIHRVPGLNIPGIGTALLQAGTQWLTQHRPEIALIQAEILPENIASQRAFEKAGYRLHHQVYEYALPAHSRQQDRPKSRSTV